MSSEAASKITQGAISALFEPNKGSVRDPIVQCVQVKLMTGNAPERYRLVFSDVRNFVQSVLSIGLNAEVTDGRLKKGVLVKLTRVEPSVVKGRKILMVLGLEVLTEYGENEKIGEPQALELVTDGGGEDVKPQPGAIPSNNFYGNKPNAQAEQQQQHQKQQNMVARSGPPKSVPNGGVVTFIEALSPYSHKWTIKARCTHKGDIKTWHNKNGEGKLFSANFLDESAEIRATGFNDQCDMLYDVIQENSVYYISSPCRVQPAKKQFSNLKHDYELTFERDTAVEKAEDQSSVPQVRYNFTNIGDLQAVEKDTTIDTIGILKEVAEVSQVVSKTTSKPYDKRELTIVDNSGYSVRLTIWGNAATTFDAAVESVIAFKGVKVSDYGGRSLSLLSSGSMTVDPDIDDAHALKGWYDAQGRQDNFSTHAGLGSTLGSTGGRPDEHKIIAQVRDENLGMSEKPDYFTLKATISYIKQDNIAYPACQSDDCNKKVVEVDLGQWRCENCDKTWPKPQHRYIMSVNVCDHTGQLWLSCFDDTGRAVMGMSADELMELKTENDTAYTDAFAEANCKTFVFRCKAKLDNFQDQQRVRYQVSTAGPLNFSHESAKLAAVIKKYNVDGNNNNINNNNSLFVA